MVTYTSVPGQAHEAKPYLDPKSTWNHSLL